MNGPVPAAPSWRNHLGRVGTRTPVIALALAVLLGVFIVTRLRLVASRNGMFYAGSDFVVGADFIVFYSAGSIVAAGDGHELYDPARRLREQRAILGRDRGLSIFPYPAFVAVPYALVSRLPFATACMVAVGTMLGVSLAAVLLLRPVSPTVRAHPLLVALAVLDSEPLNAALLGGQTVPFTLLCFAGLYAGLQRQRAVAAGAWLGRLCYKPQMAMLIVPLLRRQRRWREPGAACLVLAVLTLMGAAVAGIDWPWKFCELTTGAYHQTNSLLADGDRAISPRQLLTYLAGLGFGGGAQVLAGTVLVMAVVLLWRLGHGADASASRFAAVFAAAVAATLVVSRHALFYEGGSARPAADHPARCLERGADRSEPPASAACCSRRLCVAAGANARRHAAAAPAAAGGCAGAPGRRPLRERRHSQDAGGRA